MTTPIDFAIKSELARFCRQAKLTRDELEKSLQKLKDSKKTDDKSIRTFIYKSLHRGSNGTKSQKEKYNMSDRSSEKKHKKRRIPSSIPIPSQPSSPSLTDITDVIDSQWNTSQKEATPFSSGYTKIPSIIPKEVWSDIGNTFKWTQEFLDREGILGITQGEAIKLDIPQYSDKTQNETSNTMISDMITSKDYESTVLKDGWIFIDWAGQHIKFNIDFLDMDSRCDLMEFIEFYLPFGVDGVNEENVERNECIQLNSVIDELSDCLFMIECKKGNYSIEIRYLSSPSSDDANSTDGENSRVCFSDFKDFSRSIQTLYVELFSLSYLSYL